MDVDVVYLVYLFYGVECIEDLCKFDEFIELCCCVGCLEVYVVVVCLDFDWDGCIGLVIDLFDEWMLVSGDVDVYLCGLVVMVDVV